MRGLRCRPPTRIRVLVASAQPGLRTQELLVLGHLDFQDRLARHVTDHEGRRQAFAELRLTRTASESSCDAKYQTS